MVLSGTRWWPFVKQSKQLTKGRLVRSPSAPPEEKVCTLIEITGDLIGFPPKIWGKVLEIVTDVYMYHQPEANASNEILIPSIRLRGHMSVKKIQCPKSGRQEVQFTLTGTCGGKILRSCLKVNSEFFRMDTDRRTTILEDIQANRYQKILLMNVKTPEPSSPYWN